MLKSMKILIIIPTYNESKTIEKIVHRIFSINDNYNILVVDDGSPDGTRAIIENMQIENPNLFLLKADKPKYIITVASVFILINSISGIIGQLTKNIVLLEIQNYWYLLVAVLIGGQMCNFLNLKIFPVRILALVTASLVLFVALRMGIGLF